MPTDLMIEGEDLTERFGHFTIGSSRLFWVAKLLNFGFASCNDMDTPTSSFWDLLAEKLTEHPELIAVARENCARWLREGHSGEARLREWDELLAEAQASAAGFDRLLIVLGGAEERAARLRDFHPMAGILTREERRRARELCGYRH